MIVDADVAAVHLDLKLFVFVPLVGGAAQGAGQQQEPQCLAVQGKDAEAGPSQQRPQLVGPGLLANGVEAPVQDALPVFQRGQQSSKGFRCFLRLLGQVLRLSRHQVAAEG